jgi:hypothetical protein
LQTASAFFPAIRAKSRCNSDPRVFERTVEMDQIEAKQTHPTSTAAAAKTGADRLRRDDRRIKAFLPLLLCLPCFLIQIKLDNDIWFLLNSGRYVLQHGIPFAEPFTMHHQLSFVMQQWLSDVIFWGIYAALGAAGLIAAVFLLFGGILFLVYRLALFLSNGNRVPAVLTAFFAGLLLSPYMVTRPILFTLLILALELYLLERFIGGANAAFLLPLPVLSALLINLHAAMWPIQFVLLLPYAIDSFRFRCWNIEGQGYSKRVLFPAIALMLLAGFANPYGVRAMTYLFRSYGYAEINQVNEMKPANINTAIGVLIFGAFLLVGALYLLRRGGKTRLRYALLTLGTAVLALSSVRSFPLFAICGVFPLAYWLSDLQLPQPKKTVAKGTRALRAALGVLVLLGVVVLVRLEADSSSDNAFEPASAGAVRYLLKQDAPERMVLYTGYNDGGYAEFMGFHPYLDPRAEVFVEQNNQQSDIMKEYFLLQAGKLYYKEVLNRYEFTHLLVPESDILHTYLPYDTDYRRTYDDGEYAVYQRN